MELGPFLMTPLEEILKVLLAKRPDVKNTIPEASGLTDYISWMAEEFGETYRGKFTVDNILTLPESSGQHTLAQRLIRDPMDRQAMASLSAEFASQSEHWSIQTGRDISISRMLRYMPGQWHSSEYFEVYYAPEGPCTIHFREGNMTLSDGAILIVAPGIVHATPCYADDAILFSIMVRRSTFEQVFWKQLPESSLLASFFRKALSGDDEASWLYFDTHSDEELRDLCARMEQAFRQAGSYDKQLMNALLTVFFILVLKKFESTARLPRTGDFYWKHEYSAILSFIQKHFADAGIEDVAREFNYSTRQISRILKDCLGLSYAHLILKLRMEQAAALLSQGEMPIALVGSQVGYADNSSFYRAFTQYYGKTPKDYRTGRRA
mgnify:CR=1 FL=1